MWRITFASLTKHASRWAATTLAVVLGVGFTAGTLIFGDTAQAGFDETFARTAKNVDVAVLAGSKPLTAAQLLTVSHVDGVDRAEGRMLASVPMLGSNGRPLVNNGRSGYALSVAADERLRGFDLDGHAPGAGEALLDKETAAHEHLSIGQTIQVLDRAGAKQAYTISGLADFGVSKAFAGLSVVGLPPAQITRLTGETGYREIVVRARSGVGQRDLAARVRAALANGATVKTGDQRRADLANEAVSVATQFTLILLIFGVISLIVAVFVIYNTFAILLAQRVRETALLRCVGATRRQIFAATLLESATIGLVGGAFGVLAGIGISYGLPILLNGALRAGVPQHAVVVRPTSVLIGLTLGVAATMAAAAMPALRATRTMPLAALRDLPGAATTGRRAKAVRAIAALAIAGVGVAITIQSGRTSDAQTATLIVVGGGVVVFLGVLVASPLFIGRLIALVGLPAGRLGGPPGRVAVANARRNPGRTAVTTASLMIGVGLTALFSMLLGSIKATARAQITSHYPVDYVITGVRGATGQPGRIPVAYAAQLRQHPELAMVAAVRQAQVRVDGTTLILGAVDRPEALPGMPAVADGTVLVDDKQPDPRLRALRTAGSTDTYIPGVGRLDGLVSWAELSRLAGTGDDTAVLVKAADGVGTVDSRDILDRAGSAYPLVEVDSVADLSSDLESAVNGLIGLFAGLLGTAVVIALFGIANTLSLSVIERTRESATLRALGLTRGQLRGMLLAEALLMGVVGALVGIAFGLVYAPLVLSAAFGDFGPIMVVQWGWLAGLVLLAAVASCLAAVLPARRAARAAIVAAMADS